MENHPDSELIERLRRLVIAADNVIQAADQDRKVAHALMEQLKTTDVRVQQSLQKIPEAIAAIPVTIKDELTKTADLTAREAARLLTGKFTAADKAAEQAAERYQTNKASWRSDTWWLLAINQLITWAIVVAIYFIHHQFF